MKKCPYHALTSIFNWSIKKDYPANAPPANLSAPTPASGAARIEKLINVELNAQLRMIALTEEDLRLLQSIQPFIMDHIDSIVDDFYNTVIGVNGLKDIIERHSTVERLRETLRLHLIEMFDGRLDADFVQKRLKIAQVHQRIGLAPIEQSNEYTKQMYHRAVILWESYALLNKPLQKTSHPGSRTPRMACLY